MLEREKTDLYKREISLLRVMRNTNHHKYKKASETEV